MRHVFAILLFLVCGCTSSWTPVLDPPAPLSLPESRPRLFEQTITCGEHAVPVLHATESEFFRYRKEFLTAPITTQHALRGIICYASTEDALDRTTTLRIEALFGKAMADECGGAPSRHWGVASVTQCFPGAGAVAHCHSDRIICIITPKYYDGVMRHEALHALSFSKDIEENRLWRLLWLEKLYVGRAWSSLGYRSVFPRDGFVTSYATKHYNEDMAEFVEACYVYFYRDALSGTDPYLDADLRDPRWCAKLNLLRDFRAITEDEHRGTLHRLTPQ